MFDANAISSMVKSLEVADLCAAATFIAVAGGYRFFLYYMSKPRRRKLTLTILHEYRLAWVRSHGNNKNPLVIIQTLRNSQMSASFFASTAILLIGASLTIFNTLFPEVEATSSLQMLPEPDKIMTVKILLIMSTLSYIFLHFTWYIREVNNLAYMLTLPFEDIEKSVDEKAYEHTARLLELAGHHYSLGIRGYFFIISLFLWFFGNSLLYISLICIVSMLLLRDLAIIRNK